MLVKQRTWIAIAVCVVIAGLGGSNYYIQQGASSAATHYCTGVAANGSGYSFSLLHVSNDGLLRDQDNCEVLLTGFDWQTSQGTGTAGGSNFPPSQMATDMAQWKTDLGVNVYRLYVNSYWYNNNVAEVAPILATYATYPLWIKGMIGLINAAGAYAIIAPDNVFHESPSTGSGPNQQQGECDYAGSTAPGCSSFTAGYTTNGLICKDGADTQTAITMMKSLAAYEATNNGAIFETQNETNDACGHSVAYNPDTSSYNDYQSDASFNSVTYPQPYLGTAARGGGKWYDDNTALLYAIRQNQTNGQLSVVTGQGGGYYFCGVNGDPSAASTCGALTSQGGTSTAVMTQYTNQTGDTNLLYDYHPYPSGSTSSCGGGYMVDTCGAPQNRLAHESWEVSQSHAAKAAVLYGEYGGQFYTNDNSVSGAATQQTGTLCIPIMQAKRDHINLIYYQPQNILEGNTTSFPTSPSSYSKVGLALATDLKYVRGDPSVANAVDWNNSTSCAGY